MKVLFAGVCLGVAGLSLAGLLVGVVIADQQPAVQGDPRCFVAQTPIRMVQTRTIDEALDILRKDLADAEPGQAGMLLVRGCR